MKCANDGCCSEINTKTKKRDYITLTRSTGVKYFCGYSCLANFMSQNEFKLSGKICPECEKEFRFGDRIIFDFNGFIHADCLTSKIFG